MYLDMAHMRITLLMVDFKSLEKIVQPIQESYYKTICAADNATRR